MHISHAKKRYVRRLAGYALNPLTATARSRLGREQDYLIGGHTVVLPPGTTSPSTSVATRPTTGTPKDLSPLSQAPTRGCG